MNISDFAHIAFQAGYIVAEFDFASSPTGCRIYRTYWRFPRIAAPIGRHMDAWLQTSLRRRCRKWMKRRKLDKNAHAENIARLATERRYSERVGQSGRRLGHQSVKCRDQAGRPPRSARLPAKPRPNGLPAQRLSTRRSEQQAAQKLLEAPTPGAGGVPFENFRSGSKPENLHASSFRQLRTQSMRNFYDEYDLYYNGDKSDSFGFADPGGKSTLRAASKKNPRNLPCPTCNAPNRLTPADRANGYQCESCADADMVKL